MIISARHVWLAVGCVLAGCGRDAAPRSDSVVASAPASAAAGATPGGGCPRTGHWTPCIVRARLKQSGFVVRDTSTVGDLPRLGPTPELYTLGNAGLAVYLFADASARTRAAATLDTARFIAPSAALSMRGEATAIQNDNLLALLFSRNDQRRERVSDAFMAGAPQP